MSKTVKDKREYAPGKCYYFFYGFGTLLIGIGTIMIGFGAFWAGNKADVILNKILEMQKKVEELGDKIKDRKASEIMTDRPVLSSKTASYEQIKNDLMGVSSVASFSEGIVILPKNRIDELAKEIFETKNIEDRFLILKNALKYIPAQQN